MLTRAGRRLPPGWGQRGWKAVHPSSRSLKMATAWVRATSCPA